MSEESGTNVTKTWHVALLILILSAKSKISVKGNK